MTTDLDLFDGAVFKLLHIVRVVRSDQVFAPEFAQGRRQCASGRSDLHIGFEFPEFKVEILIAS